MSLLLWWRWWWWQCDGNDYDNDGIDDGNVEDDDDLYIMTECLSVCLCVTKNHHFLYRSVCQPWKWRNVVSWFLVGFLVFSRWFRGFSWFLVGCHGFSRFPVGFSMSLMVPGWLNPSWAPQARSETLRTPKRYSLHLYLGPTIPLGLAGRRPALA